MAGVAGSTSGVAAQREPTGINVDLNRWGMGWQVNESMQREMLEGQLEAQAGEARRLRGRLDAALRELCAAATPSNPRLLHILKARALHLLSKRPHARGPWTYQSWAVHSLA